MTLRPKKTLNRRVTDASGREVSYYKWLIADVPREDMEALGWDENDELAGEIKGDSYVLRRRKK